MNSVFLLVCYNIIVSINYINGQFTPLVAFHENLPAMYKTDKGWVVSDTVTNKLTNHTDIVKFCQDTYPNHTVINAVPLFHKEVISNWCKVKEPCTAQNKFEIHPIECINANYSYRPIYIPSNCKLNIDQGKGCLPFHSLKQTAKTHCDENDQTLHDLQVIFPCKDRNMPMVFSEVEYICCSNGDEMTLFSAKLRAKLNGIHKRYTMELDRYQQNKSLHLEHDLFSKIKRTLEQSYRQSLGYLDNETTENFIDIIRKNHEMANEQFRSSEIKEYKTYTHNFESITHKFKRALFDLDNIHIRRVVRRSSNICRHRNNTDQELSQCLRELDNVSKKLTTHFRKMLHLQGNDRQEYLTFIESRLKHLYSKYLPLVNGNKMWSDKFHDQLLKYCSKLKASAISRNKFTIKERFKQCKNNAALYLHNQEHYLSLAPMVTIIAAVIFVFLCIVSTVVYRHGGNPFRRGTHNYVMRVVGDPIQATQSINRPEVKLNLYENPIVNSRPSLKHIEKQSLVENMEN